MATPVRRIVYFRAPSNITRRLYEYIAKHISLFHHIITSISNGRVFFTGRHRQECSYSKYVEVPSETRYNSPVNGSYALGSLRYTHARLATERTDGIRPTAHAIDRVLSGSHPDIPLVIS